MDRKIDDQNFSEEYYISLGKSLQKLKKFAEATNAFRQAIEIAPQCHWAYIFLGDTLARQGEMLEAIEIYQVASQKQIAKTHPHVSLSQQQKLSSSAPSFLIIGQAKCGTTSLYTYLTQHPQILPAIRKEINFWNRDSTFNRGLNWYLAHFPSIASGKKLITGEATTTYLDSYKTAQRLLQFFPHMKLIILLRNPVERVLSHYYMNCRYRWESSSLEEAIFSELEMLSQQPTIDLHSQVYATNGFYITRSKYVESIKQWMELFPKEQFLILQSEDFFSDPAATVDQVFQFLELEPYQLQKYPHMKKGDYPPISQSMHQFLSDYFRPFNQQLEEYLDRKFNWDC
ncbi:MAG: tetratricopeptide repeat protein [Symploca sp. SIO1A3]|nr:tetratricopeptide repeat protein [Symploca sp. SIO1A3]